MEKFFKRPALILGVIAAFIRKVWFNTPRLAAAHVRQSLQRFGIKPDDIINFLIRFLPEEHYARVISKYIDDTFGGNSMILLGLERSYGNVFEPEFLRRIKDFAEAAENIEFVKDVTSIMSAEYITAEGDSIIVDDMVAEDFSGTAEEIAELRRRIASWDMLRGTVVSDDLPAAQIIVNLEVTTDEAVGPEVTSALMEVETLPAVCSRVWRRA
jgi:predicted RND superfamily exporter protein